MKYSEKSNNVDAIIFMAQMRKLRSRGEMPANLPNPVTSRVGIGTESFSFKTPTFNSYSALLCCTFWCCVWFSYVVTVFVFQKTLPLSEAYNIFQRISRSRSYWNESQLASLSLSASGMLLRPHGGFSADISHCVEKKTTLKALEIYLTENPPPWLPPEKNVLTALLTQLTVREDLLGGLVP